MNEIKEELFKMYQEQINGHCSKCKDKNLNENEERVGPISFFHIGKNMDDKSRDIRLLFVGKTSWFEKSDLNDDEEYTKIGNIWNVSNFGEEGVNEYTSAYWRYIRDIINSKKLGISLDDIGITNLTKCNIINNIAEDKSVNVTGDSYFENCFNIFKKEIEIINPSHIVFFTGAGYDYLIRDTLFGFDYFTDEKNTKGEILDEWYKTKVFTENGDKRKTWWWHRSFTRNDKKELHFLRVRHPRGAPNGLKKAIIKWIKK